MDDELQNLEAELQRLRPRAPSPALVTRIERELARDVSAASPGDSIAFPAPHVAPAVSRWWWTAFVVPAAAALVLGVFLLFRKSTSVPAGATAQTAAASAAPDTLKPLAAENLLFAARDEGLVTLDDGTPARRERLQYVDTIVWKNPRTNASLTLSVPREEVRIVPVLFQ